MGMLDDILKLTKLKAKQAKEDVHSYVKKELKKAEEKEKQKKDKK
jgi:hypothetical protein